MHHFCTRRHRERISRTRYHLLRRELPTRLASGRARLRPAGARGSRHPHAIRILGAPAGSNALRSYQTLPRPPPERLTQAVSRDEFPRLEVHQHVEIDARDALEVRLVLGAQPLPLRLARTAGNGRRRAPRRRRSRAPAPAAPRAGDPAAAPRPSRSRPPRASGSRWDRRSPAAARAPAADRFHDRLGISAIVLLRQIRKGMPAPRRGIRDTSRTSSAGWKAAAPTHPGSRPMAAAMLQRLT